MLAITDCNSSKASCLKKSNLTKKSMVNQCFNKVEPAKSATLSKNGAHLRPFYRSAVNSNVFTKQPPWRIFLFSRSRVAV